MFDGKAFGEEMVAVVRDAVGRAVEALRAEIGRENAALRAENEALAARLTEIEARDVVADLRPEIEALARAVEALPGAPDLSGLATKAEVAEVRAAIPAIPDAPDLSGFATKDELAEVRAAIPEPRDFGPEIEAVRAAIPALPEPPDLSGFATKDELAEVRAAIPEPRDFGPEIEAVRAAIPALPEPPDLSGFATKDELAEVRAAIPELPEPPDLSHLATKDDVAEAVAAIVIPEAIKGEDADPAATAEIVIERIEERLAEADRRIDARLAEVKDGEPGKDGMLPVAEPWTDRVHYRGAVVTHGGALWQAGSDTGREPGRADWICLAARGEDGRTPEFVGTYAEDAEFRRLDVVALNGGSFVALRDNPGPCPGDGWQLLAGRGKPGPAVKGDKGPPGDKGNDAAEVVGFYRDGDEVVLTFADGRELRC